MYDCQTRQEYQWIAGGCKNILESPNLKKFYYNKDCVDFGENIELTVKEIPMRIQKNNTIMTPKIACGSVYVGGLGVGIYNIEVELPIGKYLNPEIRLVNMFDESNNALQILKAYTGDICNYKKFLKRNYNIFTYLKNSTNISDVYMHKKRDYPYGVKNESIYIHVILTSDCVIMKVNGNTIMAVSKADAYEVLRSLNAGVSLAMVFALNVESDFSISDLKSNFKILSFDFMPLHKINSSINK